MARLSVLGPPGALVPLERISAIYCFGTIGPWRQWASSGVLAPLGSKVHLLNLERPEVHSDAIRFEGGRGLGWGRFQGAAATPI